MRESPWYMRPMKSLPHKCTSFIKWRNAYCVYGYTLSHIMTTRANDICIYFVHQSLLHLREVWRGDAFMV